jgi:oligosaccharide translocation protein RFT1
VPCLYVWLQLLSSVDDVYAAQYKFGCLAIAFSCIIELTAEAPIFVGQVFCFVKLKVILDTLHIFIRSVVFILLVVFNKNIAIYAFGVAQIVSALTIIVGNYGFFYWYISRLKRYRQVKRDDDKKDDKLATYFDNMADFPFTSIGQMVPGVLPNEAGSFLNTELQTLVLSFAKQGVLKQVLTEGEKYVMSVSPVLSFSEQATYEIVNNMGSLAARFIFRPIEDSSYFYFTQTIARDIELKDQSAEKVTEAAQVLSYVCKIVTSIGLLGLVFGQSYAGTLLLLYGGPDFVEGGLPEQLLRWHCLAIVLLAVNGITEGYMFATNTSKQIDSYNYSMAVFSVTFLLLSYQLTNMLGPVGFILANCCNMLFRISYSIYYIGRHFKDVEAKPTRELLPGRLFVAVLVAMGVACYTSKVRVLKFSILYHLLVGVVCTGVALGAWAFENRRLIAMGWQRFRAKAKDD